MMIEKQLIYVFYDNQLMKFKNYYFSYNKQFDQLHWVLIIFNQSTRFFSLKPSANLGESSKKF